MPQLKNYLPVEPLIPFLERAIADLDGGWDYVEDAASKGARKKVRAMQVGKRPVTGSHVAWLEEDLEAMAAIDRGGKYKLCDQLASIPRQHPKTKEMVLGTPDSEKRHLERILGGHTGDKGMSVWTADRYAAALGLHPMEIWGELWLVEELTTAEKQKEETAKRRKAAAEKKRREVWREFKKPKPRATTPEEIVTKARERCRRWNKTQRRLKAEKLASANQPLTLVPVSPVVDAPEDDTVVALRSSSDDSRSLTA